MPTVITLTSVTGGAANVSWAYPDAPVDGLDAMRIMLSPESYADSDQNFVYSRFSPS